MIYGLGIDLVLVAELQENIDEQGDRFLERVFTKQETDYSKLGADPYQRLAGRYAAKEAVMKAFGTGWTDDVEWRSIEVVSDAASGRPSLLFHGKTAIYCEAVGVRKTLLSISHTPTHAIAIVLLES